MPKIWGEHMSRKCSLCSEPNADKFCPSQLAIISLVIAVAAFFLFAPTSTHAQKPEGPQPASSPDFSAESSGETTTPKSNQNTTAPAQPEAPATKDATDKPETASAPAGAPPPQQSSSAGQFIFYGSDGTTLSSSPVVTWDGVNQQMVFTPNITSGAQDFMDWISPVGPQYCGGTVADHQLELDIDGTFYMKGYCSGLRNEEIFDNQGNITFFGSTSGTLAGGWAVDYTNGDTCIVYINHDGTQPSDAGTCGDRATRFNNITGLATQYAGLQSSGTPSGPPSNGFPYIIKAIDSNLTGSVTGYPLYTTAASGYGGPGMYRVEAYVVATAPAPSATMQFTISYSDGEATQTLMSGPPVLFDTQGNFINFSQPFYVTGTTQIVASTVTTNSPSYHIVVRLIAE